MERAADPARTVLTILGPINILFKCFSKQLRIRQHVDRVSFTVLTNSITL